MNQPTFEYNGKRLKNISHKKLWYHTKDAPLLLRFNKTGDGQYGPWAAFEVHSDQTGEYMYKPGKDAPDTSFWPALEAKIKGASGDFVLVTAAFDGDYPHLVLETEDGGPVLPSKVVEPTPSSQKEYLEASVAALDGAREEADAALMAECIRSAEKAVQGADTEFTSEDIRAIALSIYIQRHR